MRSSIQSNPKVKSSSQSSRVLLCARATRSRHKITGLPVSFFQRTPKSEPPKSAQNRWSWLVLVSYVGQSECSDAVIVVIACARVRGSSAQLAWRAEEVLRIELHCSQMVKKSTATVVTPISLATSSASSTRRFHRAHPTTSAVTD